MGSTFRATYVALHGLLRKLRPSPLRLLSTIALLLAAGAFEGATVGLLVPLLAVLVAPDSSAKLPLVGGLLDGVAVEHRVLVLGAAILGLVGLKNLLMVSGNASAGALRMRTLVDLQRRLLERTLHARPATLERYTSGEIADVFVSECYRANRFIDGCLVFLQRSIIALSYVAAMLVLSWQLTLLAVGVGAIVGFVAQKLGRRVVHHGRELSRASGALSREVTEIVGGLRVIRTTASEEAFSGTFAEQSRAHARADVGIAFSLALQQGVIEALGVAGALALAGVAHAFWLGSGALDVPRFLAFGYGLVRLLPALNYVYAVLGHVTANVGTVEHIMRWLDLDPYPTRPFGTARVERLRDGIRFENVSFSYPDGHEPIRSLSFFLRAGETLAVLGPSGVGKSTLASLLLRLREPSHGTIRFDGTDYWEFSADAFHRAVGFVEQEPFLFNLSIADNIVCGRAGIDRETVLKALRLVQLGPLVERLPRGIDTVLAERGATLSGGQRQRLAIARAVVADPQILVLDEPTSALDAEMEHEVVKAIHAASQGRTTLMITHRPSTMAHATQRLDLGTGVIEAIPLPKLTERTAV
jgi:ABC-type multidrug transport system fused ATPase/permease subunit